MHKPQPQLPHNTKIMATTMKQTPLPIIPLALLFIFSIPNAASFTIDLIHRDSLHHPNSNRIKNALQRSFYRVETLAQSPSAEIVPDRGEYLMRFSLGTPGVETLAIADTGSDLTWVQCKPCIKCFKQNSPIFDPARSSTYKPVPCSSDRCTSLSRTSCRKKKKKANNTCEYIITYGDSSSSKGDVAAETITLGGTASFKNVTIGCGHLDQGTFGSASGIVGLGRGKESLISQMGPAAGGKFSYCLVPFLGGSTKKQSKLSFGEDALVPGGVSTPLAEKSPSTFYFLTLEGITVGKRRLDLLVSEEDYDLNERKSTEGNIIIDSGTTLTFLPIDLYVQVESAVRREMRLKEVSDPAGLLKVCYLVKGLDDEPKVPEITVHFRGADVKLKFANAFARTTETSLCLAFAPASSIAIYGNLAQMDFLVGYDLEKRSVSFKPTDCTKAT